MTSPDGRNLDEYQEGLQQPVGSWSMLIDLPKLGEKIIMTPFAHLLAWLLGGEVEDWDTLEEVFNGLLPAIIKRVLGPLANLFGTGDDDDIDSTTKASLLSAIPIIGDVAKVVQGITTGLSGALATAAGLVGLRWDQVDATEATAATAATKAASIIEGTFNGWFGSGSVGDPAEVQYTIETIKDAVLSGYTVVSKTTLGSGTWTKPSGITELIVICGGGGANGSDGSGSNGGAGGIGGGYVAQQLDPSTVTSTVSYTVGAAGTPTTFGGYVTSVPGAGGISTQFGYTPTNSSPGSGGAGGGDSSTNNQNKPGTAGTGSALATGGTAGTGSSGGGSGGPGGAGGSVSAGSLTKCGGGGGGGGGAGYLAGNSGGAGGAGGYPGGGGGGGGGKNTGLGGSVGAGGPGAAGVLWIYYK